MIIRIIYYEMTPKKRHVFMCLSQGGVRNK
jgi:hypothetical protein